MDIERDYSLVILELNKEYDLISPDSRYSERWFFFL